MDNKRIYDNYAFISYKREDEKWAEWLQRKLEGYKLPTILKKTNPSLPRHLRPIFRDKTDLGGGILSDELEKQLQNSEFLIVICSPHASRRNGMTKKFRYLSTKDVWEISSRLLLKDFLMPVLL